MMRRWRPRRRGNDNDPRYVLEATPEAPVRSVILPSRGDVFESRSIKREWSMGITHHSQEEKDHENPT